MDKPFARLTPDGSYHPPAEIPSPLDDLGRASPPPGREFAEKSAWFSDQLPKQYPEPDHIPNFLDLTTGVANIDGYAFEISNRDLRKVMNILVESAVNKLQATAKARTKA